MTTTEAKPGPIRSLIPARLDRLSWSPFHTRMVCGLGGAWILDGLQITVASSVSGELTKSSTLGMTSTEVGLIASVYLVGEMVGALVFGKMSDRLGRKRLFILTLLLYLIGTGLAAFVTGHHTGWLVFFYLTRFVAGMGIGGQYSAINSAIDEVMPSKYRGRVDIWINGSYWAGAILGSLVSYIFLNHFAPNVGWRLSFLLGPVLAIFVIIVGRVLPESPRWLVTHGRQDEADQVMATIEEQVRKSGQDLAPIDQSKAIEIVPETRYGYLTFLRLAFHQYTRRAILGATLMITQSFLYNAIFFTYALVLIHFYGVPSSKVPLYGLAFSIGNLLGPLILGPLFDSWGRKQMIAGTYIVSAVLLALSAVMFDAKVLNATTQTIMWVVIFFFASAGASAAYLTVSETWPIEIRAEAIAVFFAIGAIAGALGPVFYGALIGNGSVQDRPVHRLPDRRRHHADRRPGRGVPRRPGRRQIAGTGHQAADLHGSANPGRIHSGRIEHRGLGSRRRDARRRLRTICGPMPCFILFD